MRVGSIIKIIAFVVSVVQISNATVADATWDAIVGKDVVLKMTDSQMVSVKILAYKDSIITVVKDDGFVESVESKNVAAVKMNTTNQAQKQDDSIVTTPAPTIITTTAPINTTTTTHKENPADKSLKKEITCGPFIGLGPGIIGFNANVKNVNLFASTSFIIPIASEGEYWTGTIGVGKLIGLGNRGWKFTAFTHISLLTEQFYEYKYDYSNNYNYYREQTRLDINLATGVGVGFQYISVKGLLISFKAPILGFNFNTRYIDGEGVLLYYPYSLASMPCVVFGKSF
jgi:hypothetical protein